MMAIYGYLFATHGYLFDNRWPHFLKMLINCEQSPKKQKILIKSWWKSGQKRVIFCKKILSKNGKIFIKIFSCFLKNPYFMRFKYDTRLLFLITHGLLLSNQLHFCNGCVFCKHGCVFYDWLSSFFEHGCQK